MTVKTFSASLIVCHHSNDFRALKEIEGMGNSYLCAVNETRSRVVIREATGELIRNELELLGIMTPDVPTAQKIAKDFIDLLATRPGGKLARDSYQGIFYEIVE